MRKTKLKIVLALLVSELPKLLPPTVVETLAPAPLFRLQTTSIFVMV